MQALVFFYTVIFNKDQPDCNLDKHAYQHEGLFKFVTLVFASNRSFTIPKFADKSKIKKKISKTA